MKEHTGVLTSEIVLQQPRQRRVTKGNVSVILASRLVFSFASLGKRRDDKPECRE